MRIKRIHWAALPTTGPHAVQSNYAACDTKQQDALLTRVRSKVTCRRRECRQQGKVAREEGV